MPSFHSMTGLDVTSHFTNKFNTVRISVITPFILNSVSPQVRYQSSFVREAHTLKKHVSVMRLENKNLEKV